MNENVSGVILTFSKRSYEGLTTMNLLTDWIFMYLFHPACKPLQDLAKISILFMKE